MTKVKRQMKILEIIKRDEIETQEELASELKKEGIEVTQATISRDIKELRLIKVPVGDQKYKYALPYDKTTGNFIARCLETLLLVWITQNVLLF